MLPYIKGYKVIVPDRKMASTLINKGNYGRPLKGGGLELNLIEAAYLVESDRLTVKNSRKGRILDHDKLMSIGISSSEKFFGNYLVFRDIRNRGINIQGDDERTFLAYPRGQGPGNGKANIWIMVFREHDRVKIENLFEEYKKRFNMRMGLIAAVVDGDFDVTYYLINSALEKRVDIVKGSFDIKEDETLKVPGGGLLIFKGEIDEYARKRDMGTDIKGTLALSNAETSFLGEVKSDSELEELKNLAYRDMHSRGFLVRTGFKYGSHFRAYSSGSIEDHSDLLVHCSTKDHEYTWEGLARAIRLSHSVRKRMLFSFLSSKDNVEYLEIEWTKI